MTKKVDKSEHLVTARLAITGPVAYIKPNISEKEKKKIKFRGPKEIGQRHENIPIVIQIPEGEYKKRVVTATEILKTGEIPVDEESAEQLKTLGELSVNQKKEITALKKEIATLKKAPEKNAPKGEGK